jgi:hypothetical protein
VTFVIRVMIQVLCISHVIYILQNLNFSYNLLHFISYSEVMTNISCFVFGVICISAGSLLLLSSICCNIRFSLLLNSGYSRLTLHYKSKCVMTLNFKHYICKEMSHLQLQGQCPLGSCLVSPPFYWSPSISCPLCFASKILF